MNKNSLIKGSITFLLVVCSIVIIGLKEKSIMFSSNIEKSISKYWGEEVSVKKVEDYEAYGKKFKLVLSTSIDNNEYKYFSCYEEKMNGLYYKFIQGAEQGGSNALFSCSTISVKNDLGFNENGDFTVAYGYNKDLQVANYEVKVVGYDSSMKSDVKNKEYFIDVAKGSYKDVVKAIDKDGNDKSEVFFD